MIGLVQVDTIIRPSSSPLECQPRHNRTRQTQAIIPFKGSDPDAPAQCGNLRKKQKQDRNVHWRRQRTSGSSGGLTPMSVGVELGAPADVPPKVVAVRGRDGDMEAMAKPPMPTAHPSPFQVRYILTTLLTALRQTGQLSSCFAHRKQAQTCPQS